MKVELIYKLRQESLRRYLINNYDPDLFFPFGAKIIWPKQLKKEFFWQEINKNKDEWENLELILDKPSLPNQVQIIYSSELKDLIVYKREIWEAIEDELQSYNDGLSRRITIDIDQFKKECPNARINLQEIERKVNNIARKLGILIKILPNRIDTSSRWPYFKIEIWHEAICPKCSNPIALFSEIDHKKNVWQINNKMNEVLYLSFDSVEGEKDIRILIHALDNLRIRIPMQLRKPLIKIKEESNSHIMHISTLALGFDLSAKKSIVLVPQIEVCNEEWIPILEIQKPRFALIYLGSLIDSIRTEIYALDSSSQQMNIFYVNSLLENRIYIYSDKNLLINNEHTSIRSQTLIPISFSKLTYNIKIPGVIELVFHISKDEDDLKEKGVKKIEVGSSFDSEKGILLRKFSESDALDGIIIKFGRKQYQISLNKKYKRSHLNNEKYFEVCVHKKKIGEVNKQFLINGTMLKVIHTA